MGRSRQGSRGPGPHLQAGRGRRKHGGPHQGVVAQGEGQRRLRRRVQLGCEAEGRARVRSDPALEGRQQQQGRALARRSLPAVGAAAGRRRNRPAAAREGRHLRQLGGQSLERHCPLRAGFSGCERAGRTSCAGAGSPPARRTDRRDPPDRRRRRRVSR